MKHGIGKDFERISSSRKPQKEWEDKYKDARSKLVLVKQLTVLQKKKSNLMKQ
jgi:hypothetical protein